MGSLTPSRTPTLPPSRPWPGASAARRRSHFLRTASVVMPTLAACRRALLKMTIRRARLACSQPEGTGVNAPHVHGAPPSRQQELQHACAILAQNPRSTNSHFRPVVPGGHHSPCPLISPAFADNRAANSFNLAACPAVPEMSGTAPTNVANGVHTPFLLLPLGEATDGGAAGVPPPPTANSLLLAHPGPAGAANNLAASRQNQQRVANAAVTGVGGVIYLNKVDAESMRRPRNRDNIEAWHQQCYASGNTHD